jgi:hypothetical protein
MWETIRSGDWLDERRLRAYPLIFLLLSIVAAAAVVATAEGRFDVNGHPLGADFSQVWVAGREALAGHPERPFDLARHIAEQRAEFGAQTDVFGWHYPPFFLAPATALAFLPYLQALALWQGATLALYLAAVIAILRTSPVAPWRVGVAALAFPATLVNLAHGQNGFLTAALLGFGFLALETRPVIAGLCFGLLAYKPQFGVVLPIALAAGGHWRAILAAAATVAAMIFSSAAAFGPESWLAFVQSLDATRQIAIEQGAAGFEKIQSVFAAVRLLGGSVSAAYAAQSATTIAVVATLALLWRSPADARSKAAATIVATFLTTPYCLDYDMAALAPAIALLVAEGLERGFAPFAKTGLAAAFVIPLAARPIATAATIPLGAATMALLLAVVVWNARRPLSFRLRPSPGAAAAG